MWLLTLSQEQHTDGQAAICFVALTTQDSHCAVRVLTCKRKSRLLVSNQTTEHQKNDDDIFLSWFRQHQQSSESYQQSICSFKLEAYWIWTHVYIVVRTQT